MSQELLGTKVLIASELGFVLAQNNPRLLTNPFRIVPVDYMINTWTIYIQLFRYCTLFGLQGSSIDSLLGATLQFSGYDRERNVTVKIFGPSIE
ncbi:unnamed protein product [Rotaria sordida]|uniref:Transmembrane protein 19 n=1 Tax=Rotaria sordida TaxID=392033 RepID=A0A815IND0_9BILA|nr:unnamed protein product [Rotaria sordida]